MNEIIEIHEFSTGIEIYGTADNWHVGGFTGNYLNSTLDSIPASVQDAISSGYFKIAEGSSNNKPAVVGREIIRDNEQWSVVAVVTKGTEGLGNQGRTASLYRYFLSEGVGNICHILHWMNQEKGGIMGFDFFDKQKVGEPHQYQINSSKAIKLKPKLQSLLSDSTPIIVPFNEPCTPLLLNEMSNHLASPRSWAFDVKGIVNSTSFQIIQAADHQSQETIREIISKTPKKPQFQGEEKQIKTVIKNLSNKTFNPEYILTIENELASNKFNDEKWEYLFDSQGANDAIKNKTYTLQTVKLLTLRAMVLPETLPEFLKWIEQTSIPDHYDVSSTFQSEVLNHHHNGYQLIELRERLIEGVKFIIPYLATKPKFLESTIKLLTDEKGIWRYYYKNQVMIELDDDFKLLSQNLSQKRSPDAIEASFEVLNRKQWQEIYYKYLKNYWQPNAQRYPVAECQPIADFFDRLSKVNGTKQELRLHALFRYISQKIIPKKLFKKLEKELSNPQVKQGIYINVYGIYLEREVPWFEKSILAIFNIIEYIFNLIANLWKSKVPFPLMMLLAGVYTLILLGIFSILGQNPISSVPESNSNNFSEDSNSTESSKNNNNQAINKPETPEKKPNKGASENSTKTADNLKNITIPIDLEPEAFYKFKETKQVIKNEIYQPLYNNFFHSFVDTHNESGQINKPQDLELKIKLAIRETLDPNDELNLQYGLVMDDNSEDRTEIEKWVKAIYAYQQRKKNKNVVGYLTPDGLTNNYLRTDVEQKISTEFKSDTQKQ